MTYKASNGLEIEVVVNRKNNKNIYFRVKEDLKLYVNAPMFLSSNSILKLISDNETDILKMYEKMEDRCKDDDKFWYLGKKYYIEVKEDATEESVLKDLEEPEVSISTSNITSNSVRLNVTASDAQSGLASSETYSYYLNNELKWKGLKLFQ